MEKWDVAILVMINNKMGLILKLIAFLVFLEVGVIIVRSILKDFGVNMPAHQIKLTLFILKMDISQYQTLKNQVKMLLFN
jgi:hypothetical protein